MLSRLHIENYILIDSLDTSLPEGLIIITGQTGAGKSILLGALSLVLGAKADASQIGEHGQNCVVEAEFRIGDDPHIARLLEEHELESPDGVLILRRVLSRTGRSRSFINDEPVALGVLQDLSERLVDIHSQHQTLQLSDAAFRMDLLDHFAGNGPARETCRSAWAAFQETRRALESEKQRLSRLQAEKDYNEALFRKLEEARLQEGELEALEAEQQQLAHAEEIKQTLCAVEQILSPSEEPPLSAQLKEAVRQSAKAARFIPSLEPLAERLESARLEIEDILEEISATNERIEVSGERLMTVEERLSLLYSLLQKHGVRTVEELIALREQLSGALADVTALEGRTAELQASLQQKSSDYDKAAGALHAARLKACKAFSRSVEESLAFLELDHASFGVALEETAGSATGKDLVRFLFCADGGEKADVAKTASGGELSRIMLSLKAMMARYTAMPTLVFDEIDTGVSGSVADKMGSMICQMGRDMQVLAITHLPQVAAKGDAHYLVTKTGGSTSINRLDAQERVQEIARMLSGAVVTQAAVDNAEDLLSRP